LAVVKVITGPEPTKAVTLVQHAQQPAAAVFLGGFGGETVVHCLVGPSGEPGLLERSDHIGQLSSLSGAGGRRSGREELNRPYVRASSMIV
jgi:hypothetical protein